MAFIPILPRRLAHATDKTQPKYHNKIDFVDFRNLPDGVQGGEPLLDGVWRARRLPLRISDAHHALQDTYFRSGIDCYLRDKRDNRGRVVVRCAMGKDVVVVKRRNRWQTTRVTGCFRCRRFGNPFGFK